MKGVARSHSGARLLTALSGVDIAVIDLWLGHESIEATHDTWKLISN
jgi:hypothetical protein